MAIADLYAWLIEATLVSSAAALAVLALRKLLRAAFGAGACHAAWSAVPVALLATLLPAAEADAPAAPLAAIRAPIRMLAAEAPPSTMPDIAAWTCIAWLCGCVAFAAFLWWQQRRFVRGLGDIAERGDGLLLADAVAGLPAAVGVWNARIVMPADAMSRYDTVERGLMLAHEREHIARGDLLANAFVAVLRCLFWFNPLVHFAARRFRHDQELACDARVIARHPQARRAYGEAMLKTQMATAMLPLGCHWGQSHPLKERIEMLKRPLPSTLRSVAGRGMVIAILLASGYAAWAAQPDVPVVVPAGQVAADMVLRVDDGKPMNMRLLTLPGRPFSVRSDESGKQMAIEGTVTRVQHDGQPALALEMRIVEDGKQVAAPKVVLRDGKAGAVQMGEEIRGEDGRTTFKGIRVDITLTDSATQPVATASHSMPPPVYPVDVLKQGVTGKVVLIVDVATDGSVSAAKIDRSAGDARLDAAALDAVKQWKFEPAMKDGKPVPGRVRVPVEFALDGDHAAPVEDARAVLTKQAAANGWSSYDKMVHSLNARWEKPAPPADEC
ncbi:TonB family protein [Thermomonas aquatica]|uniref:TonB family protein n=1 Tax=Thermomonas aquatica TaxID=2202149 RepID=A0A5B7ZSQ1_9GAMM|nr:TonB family protein [Thermomonas aquatica]QDA57827.1 TonB family protein [Thermomonas aquatica]